MTFRVLVCASLSALVLAPNSAWAGAGAPTFQGSLPADITGPRSIAATATGEMYVVDAGSQLHRLTRLGGRVGTVLGGVAAVATGGTSVYAATRDQTVVQLDPVTGRVLRRFGIGTAESPVGLAFDAARGTLWLAFSSGLIQARSTDGARLLEIPPGSTGVARLTGIALAADGTVWVLQDRTGNGAGTLRGYDPATGALRRTVPAAVKIGGGIAVGAAGEFYVTDLFSGTVTTIAPDGAAGGAVGGYGSAPGQLLRPSGVVTLASGDLVVANMDGNRIDRFGGGAALPACPGDTDCDGLPDAWELANGLDPNDPSNALADLDRDGLNALEEYAYGTNPRLADTDGDGYSDADEIAAGFDPLNPNDHKPQVLVDGPRRTDPGLVRLSATVQDPTGARAGCSVAWKQVAGTPVALQGAATASPSFVARAAGTYEFQADGACGAAQAVAGHIAVAVNNVAPRADGGRLLTVAAGGRIDLSAAFSSDANGDDLVYRWDQLVGPAVTAGADAVSVAASVPQPGYYVFRVGATDAAGAEGAAEVPVLVIGDVPPPTALVSTPVRAAVGDTVLLDASASLRGGAATFSWNQLEGAAATLAGAAAAQASFVPAGVGRYVFEVSIAEGGLRAPPARVEVHVVAAPGLELPVARVTAPSSVTAGAAVTLDGGASTGTGPLTYTWRQVSGPAAGLTRTDRAAASAVLFSRGSYEFELVVADSSGPSFPSRVRVNARTATTAVPVAVATARGTAEVGAVVRLDGRASTGATRFEWTQVDGPWVAIEQGEVGAFRPVVPGVYGFELQVDDGAVRSAPARVNVMVFGDEDAEPERDRERPEKERRHRDDGRDHRHETENE